MPHCAVIRRPHPLDVNRRSAVHDLPLCFLPLAPEPATVDIADGRVADWCAIVAATMTFWVATGILAAFFAGRL